MGKFVKNLTLVFATMVTFLSNPLFSDDYGLQVGVGYRQDSLSWQLKDLGEVNPRVKSNLHFRDVEIVMITTKFKAKLGESIYNHTSYDYGWVVDGNLREELNLNHRRRVEHFNHNGLKTVGSFSRAISHNKLRTSSFVWDLDTKFGLPIDCGCSEYQVAPVVGFSYNRQSFKARNRERLFESGTKHKPHYDSGEDADGFCKNTNSYRTGWWGPYFGFDLLYNSFCWNAFGNFEVHLGRVERKRNSRNGPQYIDSYERTKFFWGTTTRIGANYVLCENWYLEAAVSYTYWTSDDHRDFLRLSSGKVRLDAGYMF